MSIDEEDCEITTRFATHFFMGTGRDGKEIYREWVEFRLGGEGVVCVFGGGEYC